MSAGPKVFLDGCSLTCRALTSLGKRGSSIAVAGKAWDKVRRARLVIDRLVERGFQEGHVAYGINTGFGLFANTVVENKYLKNLQTNLIRSHCAGVGRPISRDQTRRLLALRTNVLAKGYSGVRPETLQQMVDAFNADCMPVVPSQGTVGASGDLAPLSHLALGLMGEGQMHNPRTGEVEDAAHVLREHGLRPIILEAKEGLALINGTQLMTSIGAEAVTRARNVSLAADLACALAVETLRGTPRSFEQCIHDTRPHRGQQAVAKRLMGLLTPVSGLFQSHMYQGQVQDAYSLRCAPQVHGVVHDTVDWVESILETELNSATDNPMIFTEDASLVLEECLPEGNMPYEDAHDPHAKWSDHKRVSDTYYDAEDGFVISGGNFHGEYPAKVLDYLAIGVAEIGSISERRIERLVNPSLSGLPAFLTKQGGIHSGFMIAHCTAAALVSENKVLCSPSSVDSISTSGAKEDHVSMGGFSARKALEVVQHVETIVGIELMAAAQAMEFLRPHRTTRRLEAVLAEIRQKVDALEEDRYMTSDIETVTKMVRDGDLLRAAEIETHP